MWGGLNTASSSTTTTAAKPAPGAVDPNAVETPAPGGLTAWILSEMPGKVLTGVFDPPPAALEIPWAYFGVVTGVAVAAVGAAAAAAVTAIPSSSRPATTILREL